MFNSENNVYDSIANGLCWLSRQQNPDGSFGSINSLTTTALAMQAFTNYANEQNINPLNCSYRYYNQINRALSYTLNNANVTPSGIYFGSSTDANMATGAILGAFVSLGLPNNWEINSPTSALDGFTVGDTINGMIAYLANSQNPNGGWSLFGGIYDGYDFASNNFVTSFIVGGLLLAASAGYNIPQSLYSGIQSWVNYIQSPCGGGGGTAPCVGVSISNTATLIQQMYLLCYPCNNMNLLYAQTFIANNWCQPVGYFKMGWNDCHNTDYKAAYQLMNSLLLYCITTLKNSCCETIDWFCDVVNVLLRKQNCYGYWPASTVDYELSDNVLTTVYAILALQAAIPIIDCN